MGIVVALLLGSCGAEVEDFEVAARDRKVQTTSLAVGVWSQDSSYRTLDGQPALLVGFDLSADTFDFARWRDVIKTLDKSGGNYLKIATTDAEDGDLDKLFRLASEAGVLLEGERAGEELPRATSVAEFNRLLLAGARGAVFTEYSQRNLNALRGLRAVERHLPLWDLSLDSTLLGFSDAYASAATDGDGNYVVYAPGSGRINLELDPDQVPRRVTVVGHLGTQRSELLRPPYDRHFSLLSNEERGGWIVIQRVEAD